MNAATNTPAPPPAEDLRIVEAADGSAQIDGLEHLEDVTGAPAPAPAPAPATATAPPPSDDEDDDEPLVRSAEDANLTEAEVEARRERRRHERRAKREKLQQKFADLEAQILARDRLLDQMRDELARRGAASDQATIEGRIRTAQENIRYLQEVIADGTKSQNGEAVARATAALGENQLALARLQTAAKQLQRRETEAAPAIDPRMAPLGMRWLQENADWYDPRGNDPLSAATRAIDTQLANEGFDPRSSAYWDELSRRTEPLRQAAKSNRPGASPPPPESSYTSAASQGKPHRTPVASGSSGQDGLSVAAGGSGAGAGKSFTLSSERVQALKDAGTWDDPKLRADAIRRYRQYDAEQAAQRR